MSINRSLKVPASPYVEKLFESVHDVVVGKPDGLTALFALAEGLPAAVRGSSQIVTPGLASIAREVTQLAVAKEEAERANIAKSRFLAAASHDLRQQLQTMSLLLGMLADDPLDPFVSKLIDRLDNVVMAMSGLLDKLLDINQLEAGVVEPKFCNFAINEVLQQLHGEFEIHAVKEGLTFRVVPCRETVRSDPRVLEQILRNMLSNAMKYTGKGKVLLGCRRRGDRLSIEVWDTGTGIPETELSAIFNEFHQLENHVGRRARGLGLGLAVVQRLGELLEAPITVKSRVGRGSAFGVEVPVVRDPKLALESRDHISSSQLNGSQSLSSRHSHSILILEDNTDLRDALKLLLDSHGFRALGARDGAQALEIAGARVIGPDLIIADYNLPGPNGLDAIARLEEVLARKIPSILLTGDISAATLLEIQQKDRVHLHKPVDSKTLIRHIKGMLGPSITKPPVTPTLFVVDYDREVREAMSEMFEIHGYRADTYADGSSFLKAYSPSQTGCLITDARMPGVGGLQIIERLAKMQSPLPVIMVTAYGDVATAVKAMKAGAFDFLVKPFRHGNLLDSVERALKRSGERSGLPAERAIASSKIQGLTARQREILDLVLAGRASKYIAGELHISQRTVDNHRAAIMRKVGVKTLPALVRVALTAALPEIAAARP
jgi:two-component system CheB/CheR fusion protein